MISALLAFTLVCPDTVYFEEPFIVRIEASEPLPPGYGYNPQNTVTDWVATHTNLVPVGGGTVVARTYSFTVRLLHQAGFSAGDTVVFRLDGYDVEHGNMATLPVRGCLTVIKARVSTGTRAKIARISGWKAKPWRVDGRVFK